MNENPLKFIVIVRAVVDGAEVTVWQARVRAASAREAIKIGAECYGREYATASAQLSD